MELLSAARLWEELSETSDESMMVSRLESAGKAKSAGLSLLGTRVPKW